MFKSREELSSISILGSDDNSSVRHNSVPDQISTVTESGIENISISEIGISQDSKFKSTGSSTAKESSTGIHVTQDGASKVGFMQTTPVQIDGVQIGISDSGFSQESLHQNSTSQVSTSQVSVSQVSPTQINIPQTNSFEIDGIFREKSLGLEQLNSSKISFPVTITNDQFFSGDFPNHNSTPEIIDVLNNSATKIWSDLLQSETQLNIDFQITDLPKGHLASPLLAINNGDFNISDTTTDSFAWDGYTWC